MSDNTAEQRMINFKKELKRDFFIKGVLIPTAFVTITIITCLVLTNPKLNIFPNSNDISVSSVSDEIYNDSIEGAFVNNE